MREAWTDERLDDLTHRVDIGFTETNQEFQVLRQEMHSEFQAVRAEMRSEFQSVRSEFAAIRSEMRSRSQASRSELGAEFAAVRSEAGAMHRTLLQVILGGFALMLVGFATTIATVLTQL